MVKTNIQTFSGEVEILSNLHVGNYLTANGAASNVLDITGNVGATFFVGDGGFLSNIATTLDDIISNPDGNTVSNTIVFVSGQDATSNTAIVTHGNVGISISNTAPTGEFQLSIGSNIFVNTHAANVLTVVGAIGSDLFIGDGGLLSNIATTLGKIVDQGNTVSNTIQLISGADVTSNTGLVTHKDVGISISNTAPTGEFQFGVGSNLFVNVYSSNVLSIEGNVNAQKMTLGTIAVTSAYGLNHVTAQGSASGDTISLSNVTTGLEVTSNITAGGNVTAETLITSANVEVGNRLKFSGSNVFVDTLRIADLAANLVTYDKTTGELMDSGGLFANKLAVVSVQPPSALSANATTIAKHGTYTVSTTSLAANSNAWNAFDGDTAVEWTSSPTDGHLYNAGAGVYGGTSNLFTGNYIQPGVSSAGEWLAVEFPYKATLRHMKLTPPTDPTKFPASANVYATNDSLTWTEVAHWSGVDPGSASNVQTIIVNATESFKKYAMVATKTNGSNTDVALAEWDLFAESFSIEGGKMTATTFSVGGAGRGGEATTKTFVVTVSDASGANKYYIDGVQQSSLQLEQNHTYIFDVSSTTLSGHPLIFSTTATGGEYTTGITNLGAYGGGGTATRTFVVSADSPTTLYYFCTAHAGMGATISISPTAEFEVSGRIMSRDLVVTGGTTAQRPTYAPPGTIRYNSTIGFMEAYTGSGWAPIAQPPTVTGISPLTTLPSGGTVVGSWGTGTKIVASDKAAGDNFGRSCAMNSDGTKVIVGAYVEDPDGTTDAGSAYIYTYSGSSWDTGTKIVASDKAASAFFGGSVSMNSDGTKVIVGANGDGPYAGAAYIFTYDGSSWDTGTKIVSSDLTNSDQFANSVAMSGDGTKVIVGASNENLAYGSVYIYTYSGGSWGSEVKIEASDKAANDQFGESVAMNSDGTKVIVGSPYEDPGVTNAGSAYIYTYNGSSWSQQQKIEASDKQDSDRFGDSVAMSGDGTKVIVSAYLEDPDNISSAGSVYIYTYNGSSWSQQQKIEASDKAVNDYFGYSVAMNSDGTKVIVGSQYEDPDGTTDAGAAYIYTYSGSSWGMETKIVASDKAADDRFGWSVAMSGDGEKVIVGAQSEDPDTITDAGSAYIYDTVQTTTSGFVFDTSTQVFTATGTGIVSGSTVQLEGADGSLYSVVDATAPNAAGTQVTFKMGNEAVEFPPSAMTNATSIPGYTATASAASQYAWRAVRNTDLGGNYWSDNTQDILGGYDTNAPYAPGQRAPATQDISGTTHRGHWWQLQIPNPVILTRAVIGSRTLSFVHGLFVILGSNDTTNWTSLHAGEGLTSDALSGLSTNVTTLSTGSTEAFKYFRVVIKTKRSTTGHNYLGINNIQFFGGSGSWALAQQPYKVKINSTSGLNGTSTAAIGFATGWTTATGATLIFDPAVSETQTLAGTDGGGGSNRKFSVAPGSNALPAKVGGGTLVLDGSSGEITGQIAATGTTSVTFRLTDNSSGLFTDRAINIVGIDSLYSFTSHTFTNAAATGRYGPTFAQMKTAYASEVWEQDTAFFNEISGKQGFQLWTIPKTGSYTIKAYGASGTLGGNSSAGRPAWTQGTFSLTRGQKLTIIVGQSSPLPISTNNAGGGGGASWVLKEDFGSSEATASSLYLVAGGGGGGTAANGGGFSFAHADAGRSQASLQNSWTAASSGDFGSGGGASYGINGDGAGTPGPSGGKNPYNGAAGGNYGYNSSSYNGTGGFGGGGGSGAHNAGGGGGYVGGRASNNYTTEGGHGGSSRNNGTNVTFGYDSTVPIQGKVIITLN